KGSVVRVANAPRDLLSLAEVYGVAELLPVSG
ncbi:MAG: NTP-binding protein, partial [Rhodocyclaceae bacterium]|nr:NTP-binding protein [Rhodocyclaceae bacterium]